MNIKAYFFRFRKSILTSNGRLLGTTYASGLNFGENFPATFASSVKGTVLGTLIANSPSNSILKKTFRQKMSRML